MEELVKLKKDIRKFYRQKRKDIPADEKEISDREIFDKLINLEEFINADIILAYYPINEEINVIAIVEYALQNGKRVAFPISSKDDHTLTFRFVSRIDELVEGAYSIPEPPLNAELFENADNTLCIVPGLVFDRNGNRLGYGKGFYDRFLLSFNGISVGLCYSDFLLDMLPTEGTDRKVDIVISNKEEVFVCEREK